MTDGPPSKKRGAQKQITKDDDPNEDDSPVEFGTFKKASDEVLKSRRILKVKRSAPAPAPTVNPFAGIQLVPPTPTVVQPVVPPTSTVVESVTATVVVPPTTNQVEPTSTQEVTTEVATTGVTSEVTITNGEDQVEEAEKPEVEDPEMEKSEKPEVEDAVEEKPSGKATMSFQQVSSGTNAFGSFGTGFSSSTFSFGVSASSSATASSFSFGSSSTSAASGFGFTKPAEGFSLFGNAAEGETEAVAAPPPNYATVSLQEVRTETGEEKEKQVFAGDATLYEFVDQAWKERGKGEIKLNVGEDEAKRSRLVMRSKGNLKLLLNAGIFPDMKLGKMDNKSVTFACINSASGNAASSLTTYAIKLRDGSKLGEFIALVEDHRVAKGVVNGGASSSQAVSNKEDAAAGES